MATIEETEVTLADKLGQRWYGPVILKASTANQKLGQIRKAYYDNGTLEEVRCIAPGGTEVKPECWPDGIGFR